MANYTLTSLFFGTPPIPPVNSVPDKKNNISNTIIPLRLERIMQDTLSWRDAQEEAERAYFPYRVRMQQLFIDTVLDGHVKACKERRTDMTLLRDWHIIDKKGVENDAVKELLNKQWFSRFIKHSLDAIFYGYSLIELGDVKENEFPLLKVVKRWNISPDRFIISNIPYNPTGTDFTDKQYSDWYPYISTENEIGTSPCGYGLLYEVGLYQIFLRHITGQNANFLELFGQPIRVGRTNKIEESERGEFAQALSDMGSAGWILMDSIDDTIELIESKSIGNSYQAFANFEKRLQQNISKIILGHADALDSVPGKLGASQGSESPTEQALEDKKTKDGLFITNIINTILLPRLRKLGFDIPQDVKFEFKNNSEVFENNNRLADLAIKINQAGLQIDAEYFEQETGLKLDKTIIKDIPSQSEKETPSSDKQLIK